MSVLRKFSANELASFASETAVAKVYFDTSLSIKYDEDYIATRMGALRTATLLAKIEGKPIVDDVLYEKIKELEEVALTYFRGSKISNANYRVENFTNYLKTEKLNQTVVMDFIYRLEIHTKEIQPYKVNANVEYVSSQAIRILNFFKEHSELVSRYESYTPSQSDLRKLLDYSIMRLSQDLDIAKINIKAVRQEMPGTIAVIDTAAAFIGKAYIFLKTNNIPYTDLDDKLAAKLYDVAKQCLKYHRDFYISGAENNLAITKGLLGDKYNALHNDLIAKKENAIKALTGGDNYEQECADINAIYTTSLKELRDAESEEKKEFMKNLGKGESSISGISKIETYYKKQREDLKKTKDEKLEDVHFDKDYRQAVKGIEEQYSAAKIELLENDSLFSNDIVQSKTLNTVGRMKWHRRELAFYKNKDSLIAEIGNLKAVTDIYTCDKPRNNELRKLVLAVNY